MPYSEAQKRASIKYRSEHYVRFTLDLTPEQRDMIKAAAAAAGKSAKNYILDLVQKDIEKED